MRPRIQVKYVTEHMNYLKENIHVIKPVVEALQIAVQNSKTWLKDNSDNKSVTYCDLCQELESATTAMLDVAEHILNENKDTVGTEGRSFSSQSTPQTTATEKRDSSESTDHNLKELHQLPDEDNMDVNKPTPSLPQPDTQTTATFLTVESPRQLKTQVQHTAVEEHPDLERRLAYIETTLSSLQDTQHKSTDDISEIKLWRDNFVTEQSDMGVNIEQLTKKQMQNFKNLRKQMSEQDNKVKELNKEIESLKEKESKSNKTLEKLSQDIQEYKNNVHKLNKEMQDYTDKIDSLTEEIKRHSDQMVALQEESYKIKLNTLTQLEKYSLMIKLLQQRLMPIDKLIQIFNENLEVKGRKNNKESRVCNRYACHVQLDEPTPVSDKSIISTFREAIVIVNWTQKHDLSA
ncbi:serine/threonine-protein kinase MRCK alpha-like isoform X2 [Physella acuta]|uniref:serine/threonine-protein kinase MRCK alpha-like isoform X2 n=1 Tax=Physella acuta TaxID=109671 RepID=UPI0027DCF240|nr:serine/threonine-protein kinase MRCK alpha-like isoform X2 [Physella acuta]